MNQSVLFIVINGAGLGHLTRELAVARRLRNLNLDIDAIFYTTSKAHNIVRDFGFLCYDMRERDFHLEQSLSRKWEEEVLTKLEVILENHHPSVAVFDGAYPFTAILTPVIKKRIKYLWMKREGDRPHMKALDVYEKYFDTILIPKEVGLEYKEDSPRRVYVPPITLLDKIESYQRPEMRGNYGLKNNVHLWYIQLGNEGTNDKEEEIRLVIRHLLQNSENVILLGESILNPALNYNHHRIITIREYPSSKYFASIDFAVSAAGYNTFHELLSFQVPTIFIPNKRVVKDDQVARARRGQALGVGIVINHSSEFEDAYKKLVKDQQVYRDNLGKIQFENGANQAAEYLYRLM